MTKVTLQYDLRRPLTDEDYSNIAALHSVYGMTRVRPNTTLDKLTVDYDASRLMRTDVDATLARFGVPVRTAA